MLFSRLVIAIKSLGLCSALSMQSINAAPAEAEESTTELFPMYSNAYFFQRSLQFQADLARSEYYLVWLYQGINEEVRQRQRENLNPTLVALAPPALVFVDDSLFTFPADLEDAPLRIKYMAWEELQQKEVNFSFYKAR